MSKSRSYFLNRFYESIGRIAVGYEYLEYWMREFINTLIGTDERLGKILTIPLSTRQLPEYLLALYEYRVKDEQRVESFRTLMKDVTDLIEERHKHIHAVWFVSTKEKSIERLRERIKTTGKRSKDRGLQLNPTKHTIIELMDLAVKLNKTGLIMNMNMILYIDYITDYKYQSLDQIKAEYHDKVQARSSKKSN